MRSRSRRSASNYLSAAILEIMIMGIFVIIAQPQLREAFVELLHPADVQSLSAQPARYGFEPTQSLRQALSTMPASVALTTPPALLPNRSEAQLRSSYYAPLEQFESFSVAVPNHQMANEQAVDHPVNQPAGYQLTGHQQAGNQVVAGQFGNHPATLNASSWHTAPQAPATQLTAGAWNVASAAQSPRPLSGWTTSYSVESDVRDTYPPPYGTQSQWK